MSGLVMGKDTKNNDVFEIDLSEEEILDGMDKTLFDIRCKYDFKFFCERMLGLTDLGGLHDFQLEWFKLAEKAVNTVIEAPSSSSKTEIMGVCYPLWHLYTKNKKLEMKKYLILLNFETFK